MEENNKKIVIDYSQEANSLGKRLKLIRGYFGKSQVDFAKDLGIGQSTYSNMEKERNPATIDIVKKIGKMGVSVEWVLYGNNTQVKQDINYKKYLDNNSAIGNITKLLSKLSPKDIKVCNEIINLYVKSLQIRQQ